MEQYQTCYIAFLDILGFKNLINDTSLSCQEILDIYKCFDNAIPKLEIGDEINRHVVEELKHINIKIMSDSICVYIKSDTKNALLCLAAVCFNIQAQLLSLPRPILIRGAIVLGDIYANEDRTFGPALTKAYLMEENNAKYPRIIITKETLDKGAKQVEKEAVEDLYDSVFYADEDHFYCVNFFATIDREALRKFESHVANILDSTTDDSIRKKYLYLEHMIKRKLVVLEGENNA